MHISSGPGFMGRWMKAFLTAWPAALLLSLVVSPVVFNLAHRLTAARAR
ncbi:DUF2798 domain-containing protein [Paracoccus sp. (in: a-proteobacteria)]